MVDKSKSKSQKNQKSPKHNKKGDGFFWTAFKLLLSQSYLIVVIAIFITVIPLKDFEFQAQSYQAPDYEKTLAPVLNAAKLNYKLDDVKFTRKLFNGYPGAEAFVFDKNTNSFYTGLADGRVMKIDSNLNKIELFTRLSSSSTAEKCDGKIHKSDECKRPLGVEIKDNNLYVVDAVDGLYTINLKTKQIQHIPIQAYLASILDDNVKNLLYNDIKFDPVKPNLAYISVSTTKYKMNQLPFSLLEHENSGLLLAIDLENKNGTIIDKNLYFTNGIEISTDKQYLYVAETTAYKITKLNLKQIRESIYLNKGELPKSESFITDLLGEPDNLHTRNGRIYVSFAMLRLNGPIISDYLAKLPIIRNFISKSFQIISKVIYFIRQTILENKFKYQSEYLKELEFKFYSGHIIYGAIKAKGGIVIYDETTKQIVEVIGSKEFGFLSHAYVHPKTNEILFGSFKNDFIGVIKA